MATPDGHRIVTDADTYFRSMEKKVGHQERRPNITRASDLLGPGIGPRAVEINNWRSDETTFNGFFYSRPGAIDAPDSTSWWMGTTVVQVEGHGYQRVFDYRGGTNNVYVRKIGLSGGLRTFSNWVLENTGGGGGSTDPEVVRDTMAAALVAGTNVTITPNDTSNTITISAAAANAVASNLVVDVATHGVTGDGTPADTVRFQAALTAGAGKIVYNSVGNLTLGTINVSAGTWLHLGNYTLTAKAGLNADFIKNVSGASDITISHGAINGNKATMTSAGTGTAYPNRGIYLVNAARCVLNELHIYDTEGHSIHFSLDGSQEGNQISNTVIERSGSGALNTYGSCIATSNANGMTLTNVTCLDSAKAGYRLSGRNITLNGCIGERCGNGALVTVSGLMEGLTVNGGHFNDSVGLSSDGIRLVGARNVRLNGPICSGNDGAGVACYNGTTHVTGDVTVFNNGQAGALDPAELDARDGVTLNGATSAVTDIDLTVHAYDDQATKTQQYGIRLLGDVDYVTIRPSNLRNNLNGAYRNDTVTGSSIILGKCQGLPLFTVGNVVVTATGTVTDQVLKSVSLGANMMGRQAGLRVRASGTITGTAGTKVIKFTFGTATYTVLSAVSTSTSNWQFEAEVWNVTTGAQRVILKATEGLGFDTASVNDATVDTAVNFTVSVTTTIAAAGDTVSCRHFVMEPI